MTINKPQKKHWKKRKGHRKKATDAMVKKEWYTINAPHPFETRNLGMTCVNRK
jgi:small subunit ribosomal protein S3Ae